MMVLFLLENLRRHFLFLVYRVLRFNISKKNFFNLGFEGVRQKCMGCFLVYLFLGVFFLLKSVKNVYMF